VRRRAIAASSTARIDAEPAVGSGAQVREAENRKSDGFSTAGSLSHLTNRRAPREALTPKRDRPEAGCPGQGATRPANAEGDKNLKGGAGTGLSDRANVLDSASQPFRPAMPEPC
jgi:hypothetical protein